MRWLVYFLFTIFLTYAAEWAPYYVSAFNPESLVILGHPEKLDKPCESQFAKNKVCRVSYRIPKQWIDDAQQNFSVNATMGFGVILDVGELYCSSSNISYPVRNSVDDSGPTHSSLNTFQTTPIGSFKCDQDYELKVLASATGIRYGIIDAPVVVGTQDAVARVKLFIEFMRKDLLSIVAVLFLSFFAIGKLFSKLNRHQKYVDAFENYSWFWAGFSLLHCGLIDVLLAAPGFGYFFSRLNVFICLSGMTSTLLQTISQSTKVLNKIQKISNWLISPIIPKVKYLTPLIVIIAIHSMTPIYVKIYPELILLISFLYLIHGFYEKSPRTIFNGTAFGIDGLKIMMVPFLSSSFNFAIYILFITFDRVIGQVREAIKLMSAIDWANEKISVTKKKTDISSLLEEFGEQFSIRQITLCYPIDNGQFQITRKKLISTASKDKWETDVFLNQFPSAIFSQVMTTQEPLWHISQDSSYAQNLKKNGGGYTSKTSYDTNHFTALPLVRNAIPIGAIGLTSYADNLALDSSEKVRLEAVLRLILPSIADAIQSQAMADEVQWHNQVEKITTAIHQIDHESSDTPKDLMQKITEIVSDNMNCGSFSVQLNSSTRQIHLLGSKFLNTEVDDLYKKIEGYFVSHDEQGPFASALNQESCITVANTDWVLESMNPIFSNAFKLSGTRSCAVVPIFKAKVEEDVNSDIWGLLYFDSNLPGRFTSRQTAGLEQIASVISATIKKLELERESDRTKDILQGFIPQRVLEGLMRGQNIRENETGYLLMTDIRESTRISRAIGSKAWKDWVNGISPQLEQIASRFGFKLQILIFDAFFFTKPATNLNYKDLDEISQFATEVNSLIYHTGNQIFPHLVPVQQILRSRFCVTHGDTTRDLTGSLVNEWAIVGTAMASVHKLEQACKGDSGWLFIGIPNGADTPPSNWKYTERRAKGSDEAIYKLDEEIRFKLASVNKSA